MFSHLGSSNANETGYILPGSMPPDIFVDGRLASWSETYTPRYLNWDVAGLWQELGGRRLGTADGDIVAQQHVEQ